MSPELAELIGATMQTMVKIMEHMAARNDGLAAETIREFYTKLAVQASMMDADLGDMTDGNSKQVVNCVLSDEELANG